MLITSLALACEQEISPWVNDAYSFYNDQLVSFDYPCTDEFLKELDHHPNLKKIAFYSAHPFPIPLMCFDKLSTCLAVEELVLRGINITYKEGYTLSQLSHLSNLDLSSCLILPTAWTALSTLMSLKALHLSNVNFSDADLDFLTPFKPSLTSLSLTHNHLTSMSGDFLKTFTSLEKLNVSYNELGDEGVSHLKGLKDLTELYIDECGLTDQGVAHISTMTTLNHLSLAGNRLTQASIPLLGQLTNLKSLDVSHCGLAYDNVSHLHNLLPDATISASELFKDNDYFKGLASLSP